MCGIGGVFRFDNKPVEEEMLVAMGDAIKHRGPDDRGTWKNGKIAFVHQRLSIIDTSICGHQPMRSADGRFTIVFNGEIYNYSEFRDELKAKGYVFQSNSDTEILLYLFIEYGEAMLHRLNGMFAFAIWDEQKQQLFICRDRYGVKPFYYSKDSRGFYFASEPKAIFAAGVKKEADHTHINEWLMYRYVSGEHTLLKNIKKLLPGYCGYIKPDGTMELTRWYKLADRIKNHSRILKPKEWFEETFHSSVKYRMVADVPVGVLLSGGLDSSSVAASLHHSGFKDIHTFNIGFKNYIHDESAIARKFSESLDYPFHSIYLEGNELSNTLNSSIFHLDEPLVHMNDPQILAISAYAKKHVKVLLSGEGADELMGGYVRYKPFRYINLRHSLSFILKHTPEKYKDGRLQKLERYLGSGSINQLIVSNASNYFESDFDELGLSYLGISNPYRAEVLTEARTLYPDNPMRQLLYYDQHTYLQSLNDRNDRATMAGSIECREPFQDYRLVEGLGTLDLKWLTSGKKGKRILKETMQPYLPEYITNFKKVGLSVPWLKQIRESEALSEQWEQFSRNPALNNPVLEKVNLKPVLDRINKNQPTKYESLVLQFFMYHLWEKNYINNNSI